MATGGGTDRGRTPAEGPLGPGHAPSVDPFKGFRGICSGTLVMEAISIGLVLTVISRMDDGEFMQAWRVVYVVALCLAMVLACGLQSRRWAIPLDVTLAALAVVGWVVHPAMGITGILFAIVWAYLLYLRRDVARRMARGYLASQHD